MLISIDVISELTSIDVKRGLMSTIARDINSLIIKPALIACGLWSLEAQALVYGTALAETGFNYIKQIGNVTNGGLGFWQCQPSDHSDLKMWLRRYDKKGFQDRVLSACYMSSMATDDNELMWNIRYAAIVCRLHYARISEPIPKINDASKMCDFYVRLYNSGGKSSMEKDVWAFQQACSEV